MCFVLFQWCSMQAKALPCNTPVSKHNKRLHAWQLLAYAAQDGQKSQVNQNNLVLSMVGDVADVCITEARVQGVADCTNTHDTVPEAATQAAMQLIVIRRLLQL